MTSRIQLIHVVQLGLLIGSPVDNQRWLSQWGNHKQQVKEKKALKNDYINSSRRTIRTEAAGWLNDAPGR